MSFLDKTGLEHLWAHTAQEMHLLPYAGAQISGGSAISAEKLDSYIISETTDLNDYTTTGIFYFPSSATPTNIPKGVNGWLVVISNGAENPMVKQLWMRLGTLDSNDYATFMRTGITNSEGTTTWGSWFRIMTSENFSYSNGVLTITTT